MPSLMPVATRQLPVVCLARHTQFLIPLWQSGMRLPLTVYVSAGNACFMVSQQWTVRIVIGTGLTLWVLS